MSGPSGKRVVMPEVWVPTVMQNLTGGQQRIRVAGTTIRQVVNNLERAYPGFKARLCDPEEDELRPGIAVIINDETRQSGMMEAVDEDSEVHFLPAIGGGDT
jgi:molybdopterin synthase sulfur carrier subunit